LRRTEVRTFSSPLYIGPTTVEGGSEVFEVGEARIRLRKFQEELLRTKGNVVLSAPTGSGKTLTLLLRNEENAVGVYPSRALVNDQFESISSLLERGCELEERGKNYRIYNCGERYLVTKITSESLGGQGWKALHELCEKVREERDAGAKSIVLTVPEYPYYTLSGEYESFYKVGMAIKKVEEVGVERAAEELRRIFPRGKVVEKRFCAELLFTDLLFFDEFHAYSGKSFYGALALISIYTSLPLAETSVILSSATETEQFELAKKLMEEYVEIRAKEGDEVVRGCTEGEAVFVESKWPGAAAFAYAEAVVPEVVERKREKILETVRGGDKAIIIVDKIATVYEVYKRVKDLGKVVCVTSMSEELGCAGDPREADVIVGNEAISYGIDIKELKYGIITSKVWYQLVQRVGRLGRGRESSEVTFVFPLSLRKKIFKKTSWEGFVEWAKGAFPKQPVSWYDASGLGRRKVEKVLSSYKLFTYINFRDKVKRSELLVKALERSDRVLELLKGGGELHLGSYATFLFSAFRGSSDEYIIKARNFEMKENWEINKERPVRGFLAIEVGEVDEELKRTLENLKNKVIQFNTFLELLSKWSPNFVQVVGREVKVTLSTKEAPNDPVTYFEGDEGYMRYLLSVEDAVGLVETRGGEARLKGVLLRT